MFKEKESSLVFFGYKQKAAYVLAGSASIRDIAYRYDIVLKNRSRIDSA
jgi:hypothetical protein